MKGTRLSLVACAAIVLFLCVPLTIGAQTAEQLQQQIDQHSDAIDQLNKEIAQYQSQLNDVSNKKQTLQNTLDQINISLKKTAASITVTQQKISSTQLQIRQLESGIADKEESISTSETGLGSSIRYLQENDTQPLILSLASGENLSSFWDDVERVESLQAAVHEQIVILSRQKRSLTDTKALTEAKREELVKEKQTLLAQQGALSATKRAQNDLLQETKSQESNYQKILAQKQVEKESFEKALFDLSSKLAYTLDPSHIPPAGKGILRWPLDSVVITQQFGKTSSSGRLYASGTHDGVDFRASIGTPIHASLTGVVQEINQGAVKNCQYGKWVLIKHANGLSSLYAHLSEIIVSKGSTVSTGQVIGYSGNTGYATGPHLHFTVYASEAVSFKDYRCKSGYTVAIPIAPPQAYLNPLEYL